MKPNQTLPNTQVKHELSSSMHSDKHKHPSRPSHNTDEKQHKPITEYMEYVVLLVIGPIIGFMIDQHDPFFLQADFQWLMLPLMFVTVRWGFIHLSIALSLYLLAAPCYGVFFNQQWLPDSLSLTTIIGPLLVLLVTSLCADALLNQLKRLRAEKHTLISDLKMVVSRFRLLKVSHDNAVSSLVTHNKHVIFSQVYEAHTLLLQRYTSKAVKDIPQLLGEIIKVFDALDVIECANLYPVVKGDKTLSTPLATIGEKKVLKSDVMMVKRAILTQSMTWVDDALLGESANQTDHNSIISVVPLVNDNSRIYAVLCVYRFKSAVTPVQQQAALHFAQSLCHKALVSQKSTSKKSDDRIKNYPYLT